MRVIAQPVGHTCVGCHHSFRELALTVSVRMQGEYACTGRFHTLAVLSALPVIICSPLAAKATPQTCSTPGVARRSGSDQFSHPSSCPSGNSQLPLKAIGSHRKRIRQAHTSMIMACLLSAQIRARAGSLALCSQGSTHLLAVAGAIAAARAQHSRWRFIPKFDQHGGRRGPRVSRRCGLSIRALRACCCFCFRARTGIGAAGGCGGLPGLPSPRRGRVRSGAAVAVAGSCSGRRFGVCEGQWCDIGSRGISINRHFRHAWICNWGVAGVRCCSRPKFNAALSNAAVGSIGLKPCRSAQAYISYPGPSRGSHWGGGEHRRKGCW